LNLRQIGTSLEQLAVLDGPPEVARGLLAVRAYKAGLMIANLE
jgi:hypothetical protein